MANRDNNQNVSENIKDKAGAAFHSIHRGLEVTEDAAMNAVDATAEAISNATDNDNRRND
ncbi:hypothetical protein IMZ08_17815 [Bacillus luteolus]|uniref:DUF3606 domain-containing protein n=1 Tax=Litchfieldia luteola TaxID=682179 RepID=A0ABR9QN15_9BACI|nr:hypothetical protein [Cytobacillus luteolus]MBE4909895.1 hypothetical protein [Cytobacillus luteolus]MBP1942551.1 hypothetical protein [Cytobacillus luteolus]